MTEEAEKKKKANTPIVKVNPDEPVFIGLDQADNREYCEVFNGWDAQQKATDWATERAARLKRVCYVLGPQVSIVNPPQPVGIVTAVKLVKPPEDDAAEPAK
jgi:hypothetical protein